jgi:hypothetical protein
MSFESIVKIWLYQVAKKYNQKNFGRKIRRSKRFQKKSENFKFKKSLS